MDRFGEPSFLFVEPVVIRFQADLQFLALEALARQSFGDTVGEIF